MDSHHRSYRDDAGPIALAEDFTLPVDAVTATFGIIGKKGRGKTHTAAVLTEGLIRAGCVTCVIDPTGVWYGLRSSADGLSEGLPVVIFGGEHADVELRADQGDQIADLLVARRFPAVLDLSALRKNERRGFATDFLETLYRCNREPLHLIIDFTERAERCSSRSPTREIDLPRTPLPTLSAARVFERS